MSVILIDYQAGDQEWAELIHRILNETGYRPVLHEWEFERGPAHLKDYTPEEAVLVPILSPSYLSSIYSKVEYIQAYQDSWLPTLPMMVRECNVSGALFGDLGNGLPLFRLDSQAITGTVLAAIRDACGPPPREQSAAPTQHAKKQQARFVWRLPIAHNGVMAGRESYVEAIREGLKLGKGRVVIHAADGGEGGFGRRQLVREYAERYASNYRVVWTLRSEHPAMLIGDIARLAAALDLPEKDARNETGAVSAVKAWLSENSGWLLVFDNLNDPSLLKASLPRKYKGHIIITSSVGEWPLVPRRVRLVEFTREQAAQVLLKESGEKDGGAAAALAEALGDFPLALRLATGYLRATELGLSAYTDLYTRRYRVLRDTKDWGASHRLCMAAALTLSIDALHKEAPHALDLLKLCAYLAPDDIPLHHISGGMKALPRGLQKVLADPQEFNRTLSLLEGFGILDLDHDAGVMTVPRMVRGVMRDWMQDSMHHRGPAALEALYKEIHPTWRERRHPEFWCAAALALVLREFPEDTKEPRLWPECRRLLPHALSVLSYAEPLHLSPDDGRELYCRVGSYIEQRGGLSTSADAFQHALKLTEEARGKTSPELADICRHLGTLEWHLDHMKEALAYFERALALDEKLGKDGIPVCAHDHTLIAGVMLEKDNLPGAEKHYSKALELDLSLHAREDKNVARDYANLGLVCQKRGDLSKSWKHFEQALELYREVYGPKHPSISTVLKNMGGLLRSIGDLPRAKNYLKRALDIDEELYGQGHPEVARDLNNFGLIIQEMGDLTSARVYYERALEIDRTVYGKRHRKVALQLNNIASILQAQGDTARARSLYEEALAILALALGHDHPQTVNVRRNLEQLLIQE